MAAVSARDLALIGGLELVVELFDDPLAQLGQQSLSVDPGSEALEQRHQHLHVAHVGLDRLGNPGVLNLDRHLVAVVGCGAVDLPDRGGGDRFLVKAGEDCADRLAKVGFDDLLHIFEGDLRRAVAQLS